MPNPVIPPAAPTVPIYPALGSPAFNQEAYAYGSAMPAVSIALGDLAQATHTNALSSQESAVAAASYAVSAAGVSDAVLAAANFKGLWGGLYGALPKPATVKHNGRFWLLLNNLPSVAASEPGVSADWTSVDAGVVLTQAIATNTTAVPGVCYLFAASDITLSLATAYLKGDYQGYRLQSGVTGCSVDFGDHKYLGRAVGKVLLDVPLARQDLNYQDTSVGMR